MSNVTEAGITSTGQLGYRILPMHPKRIGARIQPRGIIWHFTAMLERTELALAKVWATTRGKGNGATALIRRNGEIIQFCDFFHNANHAGGPTTGRVYFTDRGEHPSDGPGHHPNSACIGIELSNPGRVRKDVEGWRIAYTGAERVPVDSSIVVADSALGVKGAKAGQWGWCRYTPEQVEAARSIVKMAREIGMKDETVRVVRKKIDGRDYGEVLSGALRLGHEDFDPSRKSDPGPLWNARDVVPVIQAEYGR